MKVSAKVVEVEGEGLISFLDKSIVLFTPNYIYTGILIGVNDSCIKLKNAAIVFETGDFTNKQWKDVQNFGNEHYIQTNSIISFGPGK